jgi:hypothetical protein
VRRVESRYENSRDGRTCFRDRLSYKRIYEGSMIEDKLQSRQKLSTTMDESFLSPLRDIFCDRGYDV